LIISVPIRDTAGFEDAGRKTRGTGSAKYHLEFPTGSAASEWHSLWSIRMSVQQEFPALKLPRTARESTPPDGIPASVLIVDDNQAKLKAVVSVVSGMGLDVTTATSGREALRLLLKQDFALILLDVKMPMMDGFETASLIHGRPRSAHTPIIFITAEAGSDSDRFHGYTLGAVDYIYSPIIPEVLCAKVRVFVDLFYLQRKLLLQADELRQSKMMLRELASHQELIKEEERKRIAREIHDELGQNLLALRIDASMLHARTGDLHPRLHQKAAYALNQIDATIKSVRGIINDLRPTVLDLGLQAAIEWQIEEFRRRSGIACDIIVRDENFDRDLDEKGATALFRILQESLTNIIRHAQATQVQVDLNRDNGWIYMKVADNGVGMQTGVRKNTNTFGIAGIKERITMLGGELQIHSGEGKGTVLAVSIPLTTV
jgi:signal transduction histidine kinase